MFIFGESGVLYVKVRRSRRAGGLCPFSPRFPLFFQEDGTGPAHINVFTNQEAAIVRQLPANGAQAEMFPNLRSPAVWPSFFLFVECAEIMRLLSVSGSVPVQEKRIRFALSDLTARTTPHGKTELCIC